MDQLYTVYIMTNKWNTTLYTGVTSDLPKRVYEHKAKLADGFTKRYNTSKLVYFEICADVTGAIEEEKRIKAGSRAKKVKLIESINPEWRDLSDDL